MSFFLRSCRLFPLLSTFLLWGTIHPPLLLAGTTNPPKGTTDSELLFTGPEYYNRGAHKHQQGDYRGAIEDYTKALAIEATLEPAYIARGSARDDAGDPEGALTDFNQAIKLNPDNILAYYNRGLAYLRLSRAKAALDDFNQVLRLRPDDPLAFYNRGMARQSLGDRQGALTDLETAAKLFWATGNQESYQHVLATLKAL